MRKLLLALAAPLALGSPGAHAAYVGAAGYVYEAHAGNGCTAFLLTPTPTSSFDGLWYSIDTSGSSTLTPQAIMAQVALVQSAALLQSLDVQIGATIIPQIGLDYDPGAPTATCLLDATGDGPIQTRRATNFNFPLSLGADQ
jgi:hypothetical protein